MNTKQALKLLRSKRESLTAQERKTLRGQILAGDIEGALKGLERLTEAKDG